MLKRVKERLYFLKKWYYTIFLYPQQTLNVDEVLDYDSYWRQKRGAVALGKAKNLSINEQWRADYVIREIGRDTPVSIGDIACGPGVIYAYLKDRLNITEYVGYDSSDYVLEVCESLGMKGVKFDINNKEDLGSVKDADYYLLLEILEHIPNSELVLDSLYKKAKRGVFFSFPNSGNFLYRLRLLFGKMPMQWIKFPNEHLRFWTASDLKWWLGALGYTNYDIYYYRGIPGLQRIWPAMFAGSFVVHLKK